MQTTTVEITLPEDLLSLGLDKGKIQEEVEKWLVLSLFREGKISSGGPPKGKGSQNEGNRHSGHPPASEGDQTD